MTTTELVDAINDIIRRAVDRGYEDSGYYRDVAQILTLVARFEHELNEPKDLPYGSPPNFPLPETNP